MTASGSAGTAAQRRRRLPQHGAGLERPQPARARGPHQSPRRLRARPRLDRVAGPADQLPSVPPRPVALDAQRRSSAISARSSATSCSRSTRRSTREIEGTTDSEVFFYLALTLGLEEDPPGRSQRAVGLVEEIGRRHGVEHPIQRTIATTDGERALGVPLLERGQVAVALLQRRRRHAARAVPGRSGAAAALRRDAPGRLRAARRSRRGLERGARVELRRRPGRTGRAAPSLPPHAGHEAQEVATRAARCSVLRGQERRQAGREH